MAETKKDVLAAFDSHFPRLKVDARTPPKIRQEFDRLFKKLMLHEEGHEQIAVDFAKRFERGILALPTEPSCPRMGEVANALRDSLLSSPVGCGAKKSSKVLKVGTGTTSARRKMMSASGPVRARFGRRLGRLRRRLLHRP
jgi:Bacterial protein of unknown function (DUF922)